MKRSDAFPSNFLKAADLNGGDLSAVISSLEWERRSAILRSQGVTDLLKAALTAFEDGCPVTAVRGDKSPYRARRSTTCSM